ncbi:MAG: leucine-rich repeat domain-containing protein, partial [Anaeroplasma sp.]|nr:leucine-rich repeat domain-containing protein [Anaeroplasma sp.]
MSKNKKIINSILTKGIILFGILVFVFGFVFDMFNSNKQEDEISNSNETNEIISSCEEEHYHDVEHCHDEDCSLDVSLLANDEIIAPDAPVITSWTPCTNASYVDLVYNEAYGGYFVTRVYYQANYCGARDTNAILNMEIPNYIGDKKIVGIADDFYYGWYCTYCHDWRYMNLNNVKLNSEMKYIGRNAFYKDTNNEYYYSTYKDRNITVDISECSKLEYVGDNALRSRPVNNIPKELPELKVVGSYAFFNTIRTEYKQNAVISLPKVTSIGESAFEGCTELKTISVGNSLVTLGKKAFYNCPRIEYIAIPQTVTSIGEYAFARCTNLTTALINCPILGDYMFENCSYLSVVNISKDLTKINRYAFYNCTTLTTLTFGSKITEIEDHAFYATGMMNVTIPTSCTKIGNFAFADCAGLININLSNVETIGNSALLGCIALDQIIVPATVTSIGTYAFSECSTLRSIVFNSDHLSEGMFKDDVMLESVTFSSPSTITEVPDYAFMNCSSLSSLAFIDNETSSLTNIGIKAFYNTAFTSLSLTKNQILSNESFAECKELTEVNINISAIPQKAFYHCEKLSKVTVGSLVNNTSTIDAGSSDNWAVGPEAFANCDSITTIDITNNVIGEKMFYDCDGLVSFELPESIEYVGDSAFAHNDELTTVVLMSTVLGTNMFKDDGKLVNVLLASTVTSLPDYCFYGSNLTTITIPSSITSVGVGVFENSLKLNNVTIQNNVIGEAMFKGTTALKSITIPENVNSIGKEAFMNSGLISATLNSPIIGESMFEGCASFQGNVLNPDNVTYSLEIDNSYTSISQKAFKGTAVAYVKINAYMSDYMFDSCTKLSSLIVGEDATGGSHSFQNCTHLSSVQLNNTSTDAYMFAGDINITSLSLSSNFENIGDYSFESCTGLTSLNILSTSFKKIGTFAFKNCTGLTTITVPNSTEVIEEGAFNGCTSLHTLQLPFVGRTIYSPTTTGSKTLFGWIFGNIADTNDKVTETTSHFGSGANDYYVFDIPNSLINVIITKEIKLQYGAFENCSYIKSISLPSSLTEIGDIVFKRCASLGSKIEDGDSESVKANVFEIPSSVTTFGNNICEESGIVNAKVHSTTIGQAMFKNCESLISFEGENLISVAQNAFFSCGKLARVVLNTSPENCITTIGVSAFEDCVLLAEINLYNTITTISSRAFYNCERLSLTMMPINLQVLGESAFEYCDAISSMYFSESLTNIETNAFANCANLIGVHFEGTVIGPKMFYNDTLLSEIEIDSIQTIGDYAFAGCVNVERLYLPTTLLTIGAHAFDSGLASDAENQSALCEVIIPSSVTEIRAHAFANNRNLVYATFDNLSIGSHMFDGDISLTKVNFGNVQTIGTYAFYNCSNLEINTLPNTVTTIGEFAFAGCTQITKFIIPDSVTSIGRDIFWNVGVTELTTPFIGHENYVNDTTAGSAKLNSNGAYLYDFSMHTIGWFFGVDVNCYGKYSNGQHCHYDIRTSLPYTNTEVETYSARFWYQSDMLYTSENGVGGANENGYDNHYEDWVLPKTLKKVTVTKQTTIQRYSFYGAKYIEEIVISDNTTAIQAAAFYGCEGLKELTIPFVGWTATSTGTGKMGNSFIRYNSGSPTAALGVLGLYFYEYEDWSTYPIQYAGSVPVATVDRNSPIVRQYCSGTTYYDYIIP